MRKKNPKFNKKGNITSFEKNLFAPKKYQVCDELFQVICFPNVYTGG